MKQPRLSPKAIRENIRKRIASHDRSVFGDILADAVAAKPKHADWKRLAKDPEKYARSLTHLTKVAGYVDRSESISVRIDVSQLAETLVARYGEDTAREMIKLHGLPASLIPEDRTIIEAEPES